ncbi:hypothetical protein MLD38_000005 [Melastoma candidum]|uniref:Uncharacterized protein n=1 Tax=Melastoma candidum TaxID=119954 RepID=A0ACB9SAA0_9MYRT|nr:hypothetical protein MLD38_000005 [Melastoma candidum]
MAAEESSPTSNVHLDEPVSPKAIVASPRLYLPDESNRPSSVVSPGSSPQPSDISNKDLPQNSSNPPADQGRLQPDQGHEGENILGSPIAKNLEAPVEFLFPPRLGQVEEPDKEGSASINSTAKKSEISLEE